MDSEEIQQLASSILRKKWLKEQGKTEEDVERDSMVECIAQKYLPDFN